MLFSALARDGTTRHLLLHAGLSLHTPEALWEEFERNRAYLLRKSGATEAAFDLLLRSLQERVRNVPTEAIRPLLAAAERRLGPRDRLDAPYVAAARAIGGSLWTHDRRLGKRAGVRVVTTEDILRFLE